MLFFWQISILTIFTKFCCFNSFGQISKLAIHEIYCTHPIFAKLSSSQINRKQWAKQYKTDKLKEKWESRWYSFVIHKKALIKNTSCRNEVVFVQILPISTVDLLTIMPHEKKLQMPTKILTGSCFGSSQDPTVNPSRIL